MANGLVNLVRTAVVTGSLSMLFTCGPPPDGCKAHPGRCLPLLGQELHVDAVTRVAPAVDVQYPIISSQDPAYFRQGNVGVEKPEGYK